jgi:hypothetical protein
LIIHVTARGSGYRVKRVNLGSSPLTMVGHNLCKGGCVSNSVGEGRLDESTVISMCSTTRRAVCATLCTLVLGLVITGNV